ncbi:MAG: RT0821/Lpp0805 family surface protein [Pseudomonadota bacterium]
MRILIDNRHRQGFEARLRAWRLAAAVTSVVALSGCAVSGNAIDDAGLTSSTLSMAEATPTIATNPFEPQQGATETETDRMLDEDTLRLAVTTLDVATLSAEGAPWANASTGTNGRIINVSERIVADQKCRSFEATRRAYDGISLYQGEMCLDPRSGWWTRSLTNLNDVVQSG